MVRAAVGPPASIRAQAGLGLAISAICSMVTTEVAGHFTSQAAAPALGQAAAPDRRWCKAGAAGRTQCVAAGRAGLGRYDSIRPLRLGCSRHGVPGSYWPHKLQLAAAVGSAHRDLDELIFVESAAEVALAIFIYRCWRRTGRGGDRRRDDPGRNPLPFGRSHVDGRMAGRSWQNSTACGSASPGKGQRDFKTDRLVVDSATSLRPVGPTAGRAADQPAKGISGSEQIGQIDFPIVDLAGRLDETTGAFMDTAAVIRNLDLVVAPDTAIAHLAGA